MTTLPTLTVAIALVALPLATAWADDDKVIKQTLQSLKSKRAALKLESGQELSGVVASADGDTVRLTELSRMELFETVVRTERIEAVVMRRSSP